MRFLFSLSCYMYHFLLGSVRFLLVNENLDRRKKSKNHLPQTFSLNCQNSEIYSKLWSDVIFELQFDSLIHSFSHTFDFASPLFFLEL